VINKVVEKKEGYVPLLFPFLKHNLFVLISPMHILGPAPKGKKVDLSGSSSKRSGRKLRGSGKYRGSVCIPISGKTTFIPG
jgi:hypothetical protein